LYKLHRKTLATQDKRADVKQVFHEAVKIVSFVKGRPLNARLFAQFCDYMQLLFHTEARCLSRGKVLTRLFELRQELKFFWMKPPTSETACMTGNGYVNYRKFYVACILAQLNILNLFLQGKVISMFHVQVTDIIAKLELWGKHLSRCELDSFPSLHEFVVKSGENLDVDVLQTMKKPLKGFNIGLRK
jgi:hypothetical protein